ncbi:MAG: biopolymer transporter ExbD [Planctomycetota bacterium]
MAELNSDRVEPNLTPLLDMVFQLITFFMLVINFKGASMDLSLKLPVLGSARPLDRQGKLEPLLLNIDAEGGVHCFGRLEEIQPLIDKEARLLREQLRAAGEPAEKEFPVGVIIRADRAVPFHLLNHVIEVCQKAGYRQFSLSAMTRQETR